MCLNFTLAKEVQLFPGLGVYSGIFALYLLVQCRSKESSTATIIFYAICLLYVLSTATFLCDLAYLILEVSNNSICKNVIFLSVVQTLPLQIDSQSESMLFRLSILQITVSGCSEFIAQCIIVRINYCT